MITILIKNLHLIFFIYQTTGSNKSFSPHRDYIPRLLQRCTDQLYTMGTIQYTCTTLRYYKPKHLQSYFSKKVLFKTLFSFKHNMVVNL